MLPASYLWLWEELDACCFQKWTISSWCFKGSFKFRQMWRWLFLASGHFGKDAVLQQAPKSREYVATDFLGGFEGG